MRKRGWRFNFLTQLFLLYLIFSLSSFFFVSCSSPEEKGSSAPVMSGKEESQVKTLIKRVKQKYRRRFRVAVLDFTDAGGRRTVFGAFVADTAVRLLSEHPDVSLLERGRLKLLLKEQALGQSGVIKASEVKRLGDILPADVIVAGSYARRDREGYTAHGRFIDIVSGEILGTFTFFLRRPLPRKKEHHGKVGKDGDARCRRVQEPILEALKDLRQKERVEAIVQKAMLIPFDLDCGRIHFRVLSSLEASRFYPRSYRNFLGAVLAGIKSPGRDKRVRPIMEFYGHDGIVDDREWRAVVQIVKNASSPYAISRMLRTLFRRAGRDIRTDRQDELMKLAANRQIGKPRLLTDRHISLALLTFYRRNHYGTPKNFLHYYKNYGNLLSRDSRTQKRLLGHLKSRYYHSLKNQKNIREYRAFLVKYFHSREKTKKRLKSYWDILKSLESKVEKAQENGKNLSARALRKEQLLFLTELNDWACAGLNVPWPSIRADRGQLMRKRGGSCKNLASIQDLIQEMKSRDHRKKLEAAKLLADMGEKARPAEKVARRYLTIKGTSYNKRFLRQYSAQILGNIKTRNTRSIKLLIDAMIDYEGAGKDAMEALEKIGSPAARHLGYALLSSPTHGVRYRAAIVLGRLEGRARSALPALRKAARSDSSSGVRKRARAAIYSIKRGR